MPELSKTARAAQKAVEAGQSKKKEERSVEKMIADLRLNRASGLACAFTDVDALLAEYDKLQTRLDSFVSGAAQMDAEIRAMREEIAALKAGRPVSEGYAPDVVDAANEVNQTT